MRLKTLLSRSLLVAVGLLAGTSAWGQETTTLTPTQTTTIDGSNTNVVQYSATATSWNCSQAAISGGVFKGTNAVIITKFDASAIQGTITKAELSIDAKCTVSGKNSQVRLSPIETNWDATTATWANTNTTDAIGTVTNTVELGYSNANATSTFTYDATNLLSSDKDKVIGFAIYTYTAREQNISNIKLTITTSNAAAATYTVKWQDEDGNTLKVDETRNSAVGETVAATDEDKATFYSSDKTKKYVIDSETVSGTVATDNSTTITLKFKTYTQYTATLNLVCGETTETKTQSEYSDVASVTIYYPAYKQDENGSWYKVAANTSSPVYGVVLTPADAEKTITYTKDESVVYFAEYEAITNNKTSKGVLAGSSTDTSASNGTSAYLTEGKSITTKMSLADAGTYDVIIRAKLRKNTKDVNVYLSTDTENAIYTTSLSSTSFQEIKFTADLKAGDEVYYINTSGNDLLVGDYVLVTKPTVTINADSKLASYSNDNVVTVPEDVTIYIATANDGSTVTLTKVDGQVIPAKTGVILYSTTTGARTLSYGGTAPTISETNLLTGTGSTAKTVADGDNIYALVAGEQAIAKVNSGVVIPANKAYIETSAGAKLSIVFDGTVTGINSVEADGHEGRALQSIYNLAGQRVSKSYKGVVVKGGKKFLQR